MNITIMSPGLLPVPTVHKPQAAGLTHIVTDLGGISEEICNDNAITVPTGPRFVRRLCQAIFHFYKHPEQREAMSKVSQNNAIRYNKKDMFK